jgi:hypothetical protein
MPHHFRHAICNEAFEGWRFADTCRAVRQAGYTGIEITGCMGKFQVARDHGHDCGLDVAAVERVCLDHEHGPSICRLPAARFGKIGPPDSPPPNLVHRYQESFSRDLNWARYNAPSNLRWPARIHFIQAFRDGIPLQPVQELRNRRGVQLTSGNAEAAGSSFRQAEEVVGYRDRSLHLDVNQSKAYLHRPINLPHRCRVERLLDLMAAGGVEFDEVEISPLWERHVRFVLVFLGARAD